MSAKLQNTLRTIGKQILDLRTPQVFSLSEQRAQLTWARFIDSYETLPESYRESVRTLLSGGLAFPYTVLTPAYETFRSHMTEKLICAFDREIHVLERNGKNVTAYCYLVDAIQYVEVSSMLLDYRVKISGLTKHGEPITSIVRSSTSTDYLFTPVLKRIRLSTAIPKDARPPQDAESFEHWSRLNYKFMNFARNSLLEGERVVCAILQPEIKAERFKILGRTYYRTISPTHVCILTDRELIMIREEALQDRKDKYGGIWDYIPLNKVAALSVTPGKDGLLGLSIKLFTDDSFECLFDAGRESEVDPLLAQFHELTSR